MVEPTARIIGPCRTLVIREGERNGGGQKLAIPEHQKHGDVKNVL